MKPLEIFCRNRVMYAQITVHDKSMGMKDYHLYNNNGLAFYVFRKSQGEWQCPKPIKLVNKVSI